MKSVVDLEEHERATIKSWLREHHKIGDSVGGSGHLGSTALTIEKIKTSEGSTRRIVVVLYEISISTEFTCYPDNPPKYTRYSRTFELTDSGIVFKVHPAKIISTNLDLQLQD